MGFFDFLKKSNEEFYEVDEFGNAVNRSGNSKDEVEIIDYFLRDGRLCRDWIYSFLSLLNLDDLVFLRDYIIKEIEKRYKDYDLEGNDENLRSVSSQSNDIADFDSEIEFDDSSDDSKVVDSFLGKNDDGSKFNSSEISVKSDKCDVLKEEVSMVSDSSIKSSDLDISVSDNINNISGNEKNLDSISNDSIVNSLVINDAVSDLSDSSKEYVNPVIVEEIYSELVKIFGKENIFFEIRNDFSDMRLKGKEVYCFGLRNVYAYEDEDFDVLKQKDWFLSNIKRFSKLKSFKMLFSSNLEKKLFLDGEVPILICYKAINILKRKDEFEFE